MRVLIVTNDFPPKAGGIQQYLINIADRLDNVRVLAPLDDPIDDRPYVVRGDRSFMWPTPATRSWVNAQIADFTADVVVFGAPYPLAQLGPKLDVPYVVMTHGAESVIPSRIPIASSLVRRPLRSAQHVFAVSSFTADAVAELSGRPVSVLGAGVDIDRYTPAESSPEVFTIGCVSRFVPRKGQHKVLDAAEALYEQGTDCRVLMVGRGRLEQSLRRHADGLNVPVELVVGAPWDDLPGLYRQMSVFVMPAKSRWGGLEVEGLGIVYLEAAATGVPVIAGTSGGAPETVQDGVTGFVADEVATMVPLLGRLADDDHARRQMGTGGRAWAETNWTWDSVMGRFDDGLQEAIRNQAGQ